MSTNKILAGVTGAFLVASAGAFIAFGGSGKTSNCRSHHQQCPATTTAITPSTTDVTVSSAPSTSTTEVIESTTTTTTAPPQQVACSGVNVVPGDDVQTMIAANATGTTFCFQPGVYHLSNYVRPKSGDRLISVESRGAILDGNNTTRAGIVGSGGEAGQHDVLVQGFTVERFTPPPGDTAEPRAGIQAGWRWTIVDNHATENLIGIRHNTGSVVTDNLIDYNTRYGVASTGDDVTFERNEIAFNNTQDDITDSVRTGDSGATKFVGLAGAWQSNITFRNNWVHDNQGNGIWFDGNNRDVLIDSNIVEDNTRGGIDYEVGDTATISNNTVSHNCGYTPTDPANQEGCGVGTSLFHGADLFVNTSSNITIFGNTVVASNNGIGAYDALRSDATPEGLVVALRNLHVHDNDVSTPAGGANGIVGDGRPTQTYNGQNWFQANRYLTAYATAWQWNGAKTWTQWQALGQDILGWWA
jgi:parallel beta-helix repeat protein